MIAAASASAHQLNRAGFGFEIAVGILLVEVDFLFSMASRRTGADLVSGTMVVNTPPPQPHRAPAAPMYSPNDAEFGYPPQKPRPEK